MPTCEHSDICGRDALDGHDGKCILHSEDPGKDEEAFEEAFLEHQREHGQNFREMMFPDEVNFSHCTFDANFSGATFENEANFFEVIFEAKADFSRATFRADANFSGAIFMADADFSEATFKADADFSEVTFEADADFSEATFEAEVMFIYTFQPEYDTPSTKAKFHLCEFGGEALFEGVGGQHTFDGWEVDFKEVTVGPNGFLRFRYVDLSRFRLLRTDVRDIELTGVKWCEEVSEGEWFRRVGLYDEVVEKPKLSYLGYIPSSAPAK